MMKLWNILIVFLCGCLLVACEQQSQQPVRGSQSKSKKSVATGSPSQVKEEGKTVTETETETETENKTLEDLVGKLPESEQEETSQEKAETKSSSTEKVVGEKESSEETVTETETVQQPKQEEPETKEAVAEGESDEKQVAEKTEKKQPVKEKEKEKPKLTQVILRSNITPDRILLDGQKVAEKKLELSPGEYVIQAEKQGYHPWQQRLVITGQEESKSIDIALLPQLRSIQVAITYDVPSATGNQPEVILSNEGESYNLRSTDAVFPGKYLLSVKQPGYKSVEKEIEIPVGDGQFVFEVDLEASPRPVVIEVFAGEDKTEQLVPDQILLDGEVIDFGTPVKPGSYQLEIRKEGYRTKKEEIVIEAGEQPLLLSRQLYILPRSVTLTFVNQQTQQEVRPESIKWNNHQWDQDFAAQIEPGKHQLVVEDPRYQTLTQTVEIPSGKEAYDLTLELVPKEEPLCRVEAHMVTNFPGPGVYDVTADKITLDGTPLSEKDKFAPGEYQLVVEANGYQTLQETITIPEEPKFVIERMLIPDPREVEFEIRSDKGELLEPDKIMVDGKEFSGTLVPGNYDLLIEKKGYTQLSERFFVDMGETSAVVRKKLESLPREVKVTVVDQESGESLSPDEITWEGKSIEVAKVFEALPGEYKLVVRHKNYLPFEEMYKVPAGSDTFAIEVELQKDPATEKDLSEQPRQVELTVLSDSDYKSVKPEVMTLNDEPYIAGATAVKPGEYNLVVWKSGHRMYNQTVNIAPGEEPYQKEVVLPSVPRQLSLKMEYDIKPASDYPDARIELVNKKTDESTVLQEGQMIKPGIYKVKVEQMEYRYTGPKEIFVAPSSEPYELSISLAFQKPNQSDSQQSAQQKKDKDNKQEETAQPTPEKINEVILLIRGLHPDTQKEVFPLEILVNGKQYNNDPVPVGKQVVIEARYRNFKTQREEYVPEGKEKIEEVLFILTPLREVVLTDDTDHLVLDGLRYSYSFLVNGQELEEHHQQKKKQGGRFEFTLHIPKDVRDVKVVAGYRYDEKFMIKDKSAIGYLGKIDSFRLTDHLQKIQGQQGTLKALQVFAELMDGKLLNWRKNWSYEEKENIYYYIDLLEPQNEQEYQLKNDILDRLQILGQ